VRHQTYKEARVRELDEKVREAIAENVRTRRMLLGLSQEGLGEKAGMSGHGVWNIENRTRSYIRPSTMRKLAMALETTVPALYGVEEGSEGPLAADPLTSPEARLWSSERASWEHYQDPAAWLKAVAGDGLDDLGKRAGRLFAEQALARRDLQDLKREIQESGPRSGHPDRKAWAEDLTRALERHLVQAHRARMATLQAMQDAMITRQVEKLPEPVVFEIYEEANASA
jgi:transcriptional regulator with XRE-family HTH domain